MTRLKGEVKRQNSGWDESSIAQDIQGKVFPKPKSQTCLLHSYLLSDHLESFSMICSGAEIAAHINKTDVNLIFFNRDQNTESTKIQIFSCSLAECF